MIAEAAMEALPPRLLLLVALCVAVRGTTDGTDALVVQTQYGAVRGVQSNTAGTAINAWLQIPFAADPVGSLRWMPPQPAVHWAGTKQLNATTTDDDRCFQAHSPEADAADAVAFVSVFAPMFNMAPQDMIRQGWTREKIAEGLRKLQET